MKKKGEFNKEQLAALGLEDFDGDGEVSPERNQPSIDAEEMDDGQ